MTCWRFPAIVIQDTADTSGDGFDVVFPDFPGCVSSGVSVEAATNAAAEALSLHLQDMIAAGEAIPRPSTDNDIPEWLDNGAVKVVAHITVAANLPAAVHWG